MREGEKREGREGGKQHVRGWLMDTAPFGKTSLFSSYWDMQGFILMWFVHSLTYLSTAFHTMWYISGDTDPSQPPSWSTSALSSTSVLPLGSASSALRLGEPLPAPYCLSCRPSLLSHPSLDSITWGHRHRAAFPSLHPPYLPSEDRNYIQTLLQRGRQLLGWESSFIGHSCCAAASGDGVSLRGSLCFLTHGIQYSRLRGPGMAHAESEPGHHWPELLLGSVLLNSVNELFLCFPSLD